MVCTVVRRALLGRLVVVMAVEVVIGVVVEVLVLDIDGSVERRVRW